MYIIFRIVPNRLWQPCEQHEHSFCITKKRHGLFLVQKGQVIMKVTVTQTLQSQVITIKIHKCGNKYYYNMLCN